MFARIIEFLRPGFLPFVFAGLFALLLLFWQLFGLSSPEELIEIGQSLFDEYGLLAFFLIVLLEGFFMMGLYFPGSFLIILAVLLSPKTIISLTSLAVVAWIGFSIMSVVNYLFGAYGLYRVFRIFGGNHMITRMHEWLDRRGTLTIFLLSIDPSYLSVAQTAMGVARAGLLKTVTASMLSLALWIPVWTIVAATLIVNIDITNPNQSYYFAGVLILWGLVLIAIEQYKRYRSNFNSFL